MSKDRKPPAGEEAMSDINISPLIDMVFILLIFFIVTTVFVEETGVDVIKPRATMIADLEKNSILIAVTASNQVVFGGQDIGIGGVRSFSGALSSPLVELSWTRVFGLLGHPVRHSLSPEMHTALFAKYGLDAVYVAFDVLRFGDTQPQDAANVLPG